MAMFLFLLVANEDEDKDYDDDGGGDGSHLLAVCHPSNGSASSKRIFTIISKSNLGSHLMIFFKILFRCLLTSVVSHQ